MQLQSLYYSNNTSTENILKHLVFIIQDKNLSSFMSYLYTFSFINLCKCYSTVKKIFIDYVHKINNKLCRKFKAILFHLSVATSQQSVQVFLYSKEISFQFDLNLAESSV